MNYYCSQCGKEILSDEYITNREKDDGKKFCCSSCFNEYYAPNCFQCSKKSPNWVYNKKDKSKKFCSNNCMEQFYDSSSNSEKESFSETTKWIIAGGVLIVVLIIVWKIVDKIEKKKDKQIGMKKVLFKVDSVIIEKKTAQELEKKEL